MLELYHIMVRLGIHDGVSQGLNSLSRKFTKAGTEAEVLQAKIQKIKTTLLAGAGLGFMGFLGGMGVTKMLGSASEYVHTLAQANSMGLKHQQIAEAIAAAWKVSGQVQTVSMNEAMQMSLDLRYSLGSMSKAIRILPEVARYKTAFTIASDQGMTGSSSLASPTEMAYSAAKSAEMLGRTRTLSMFHRYMDDLMRVTVGTRGRVTPVMYHQAAKYMRQAGPFLSEDFLMSVLPAWMQEMKVSGGAGAGGARGGPGAMVAAFYRELAQGVMTKKMQGAWTSLGLIKGASGITSADRAKYKNLYAQMLLHPYGKLTKAGGDVLKSIPIKGLNVAISNPYTWVQDVLYPALQKAYPGASRKELAHKATLMFTGNQLAAQFVSGMILRKFVMEKDMRMLKGVPGVGEIMAIGQRDPNVVKSMVAAQWGTMMTMMGKGFMVAVLPGMIKFAKLLHEVGGFFRKHPNMGTVLIEALYGLAGAMAFSGVVLILKGAFMALDTALAMGAVATGIFEIAAAMVVLYKVVTHWKSIVAAFPAGGKGLGYLATHPLATYEYVKKRHWSGIYQDMFMGGHISGVHIRPHTSHRADMHIVMDGTIVGKLVAKQMGKTMSLASTAHSPQSKFDTAVSMPGVAYNY